MFSSRLFVPVSALCVTALLACSGGGSTQSSLPNEAAPGSLRLAAEPSTATDSTTRAGVISAATTTDTCTSATSCVTGTNSSTGSGVKGISTNGRGVHGITKHISTSSTTAMFGVVGEDQSTSGLYDGGVFGTSARGIGVWGQSTSGDGLRALSSSGPGAYITSSTYYGAYAVSTTSIGLAGLSTQYIGTYGSGPTAGLYGTSFGGSALYGDTSSGNGVYAVSTGSGTAVNANSGTGFALQAHTSGSVGAWITNKSGNGADISGTYIGAVVRGGSFPLVATNTAGTQNLMWVTGSGDLHYVGHLVNGLRVNGATVSSFSPSSSRPSIEDTGTAQLVNGRAIVMLDPVLARAIDRSRPYQVFLTPDGDTRGLYVAAKGTSSFAVREVQGGRGTFDFDYHIYATAFGQSGEHMTVGAPNAPAIRASAPAVVKPPTVPQRE